MGLLRSCFAWRQTWLQAGKYLNALLGDQSPDKSQRLLNRASRDEAAAMSQARKYAVAGLDSAARRSRSPRAPR